MQSNIDSIFEKMKILQIDTIFAILFSIILLVSPGYSQTTETNIDRPGMDYKNFNLPSPEPKLCQSFCQLDTACKAWTYVKPGIQGQYARCWLKSGVPAPRQNTCCVSGVMSSQIKKATPIQKVTPTAQTLQRGPLQQPASTSSQEAGDDERAASRLTPAEKQRIDSIAAARRTRMEQFHKTFAAQMKIKLADFRVKLANVQVQNREKEINAFKAKTKQVSATPSKIVQTTKAMNQAEFTKRLKQASQQPTSVDRGGLKVPTSKIQKPVIIKTVVNAGSNMNENTMEESSPALIFGENFGSAPGSVFLEYNACQSTHQETFQPGACPKIVMVPLLPANTNWQQSWYESAIGVRLPALPQLQVTIKVTLVVTTKTGAVARYGVQYLPTGYPSLNNVTAAPTIQLGDGQAVISGGEVVVQGSGFGGPNGQIWIDVSTPVYGKTKIFLEPGAGTWPASWNDTRIYARAPKITGDYWFQSGKLRVRNGSTGKIGTYDLGFGPTPVMTMTSGIEYLEIDTGGRSGEDYAEESNGIIHVTHETKCKYWIFSSGNKGVDWFFRGPQGVGGSAAQAVTGKKSLSPNCKVVKPTIVKVDPDETGKTIDFLINQVKSLVEDVLKENMGALYKKFAELAFYAVAGAIDSGVGKYGVWVDKAPSSTDPSLGIRWNNTCATISPLKGVPVEYTGTFLIYGPEGVCPGTK